MMVCGLVLLLASVIVAEESHDRYFKEDHYTGADYLRLAGDGSYEVIGREHMGVWVIDKGVWVSSGGELRFNSTKRKSSSFTAREATFRKLNFLVFRGSAAPGIEMAESDIRADLEGSWRPPAVRVLRGRTKALRLRNRADLPLQVLSRDERTKRLW